MTAPSVPATAGELARRQAAADARRVRQGNAGGGKFPAGYDQRRMMLNGSGLERDGLDMTDVPPLPADVLGRSGIEMGFSR